MIWYIIGAVVILGLIIFFVFGKKKSKKEGIEEGGRINGGEVTSIEPTMEDEAQNIDSEEGSDIPPEELSAPKQEETTDEEKAA